MRGINLYNGIHCIKVLHHFEVKILKYCLIELSVKSCHFTLLTQSSYFDIVQLLCYNLYC